mgnify:CR=1 FL=1
MLANEPESARIRRVGAASAIARAAAHASCWRSFCLSADAVRRNRLTLSLALALVASFANHARAADLHPRFDPAQWVLCKPGELFDFYVPNLGSEEDRETAPTRLLAREFQLERDKRIRLTGDVEILRADQRVAAQVLDYDADADAWKAESQVQYQDSGFLLRADRAEGNLENEQASLDEVRYQLLAIRGNGSAANASVTGDVAHLTEVLYTTCDPGAEWWSIKAGSLELDQDEGFGTAKHMTLRLGQVPILYLPMLTFPIDERRHTGFLFPSIGASRQRGVDIAVPYYIDIAPNLDATLTPRLMSKRGGMIGAEFRYLFENHRGEVSGTWLPNDDISKRDRGVFHYEHLGKLGDAWQVRADVNLISDDRYYEDFGDSLSTARTSLLESGIGLYGRGEFWRASIAAQSWDIADPYISDSAEPFRRLPRALFAWERPFNDWLVTGVNSEAVVFDHDDKPGATRVDLYPYLEFPFERAAGFVRPRIGYRYTHYELDSDYLLTYAQRSPTRGMPVFSLDSGLVFERNTSMFGHDLLQTLEPRMYYLNVPYRDQSGLPVFDTQELGFSFGQLFRPNRFTGADRQADANQATFALTTRLFDEAGGSEKFSASLGQIRYFQPQKVQMPGAPIVDRAGSAYVADANLMLDDRWSVGISQHWDPHDEISDLSALRTQYRWGSAGVFNFAYRFRRDTRVGGTRGTTLEQFDTSALVPLNENWRLVARWNYSLLDDATLESVAGVEWENCCLAARLLHRHYVRNIDGNTNTSLYLELELKGLSTLGRKSEELLRRGILGYSR